MTTVVNSFPGLGFEVNVSTVAFSIGAIEVKWYGIILSLGIVLAFIYFLQRGTKTEQIKSDDIYNMTLWCVPIAIIGARAMYVLTTLSSGNYKTFIDVIAIWNGGIAIYGAIIAGGITIFFYCKRKRIRVLRSLDALAPAVMLGQIIGRWGNFMNGECFGYSANVADMPWRMVVTKTYSDGRTVVNDGLDYAFVHPTFFYESLWNLIGFLLINLVLYRKKRFNGQIFFAYMAWYGLGRGFVEMLRTDSLYVGPFKISVVIGFLSFAVGAALYIIFAVRNKRKKLDEGEYVPKFAGISMETSPDEEIAARVKPITTESETEEDEPAETEDETEDNGDGDDGDNT